MINVHTHIFTIDHVPNFFGRRLVPVLGWLVPLRFIHAIYPTVLAVVKALDWILTVTLLKFILLWLLRRLGFTNFSRFLGKENRDFVLRIIRLVDYAAHHTVNGIPSQMSLFKRLQTYYPPDTQFVVLTMDMEFMKAGKPKRDFRDQLAEIAREKSPGLIPFLFLDPRRLSATDWRKFSYQDYLDYLERDGFHGLKLYPALGYYPFDWRLLPLLKYAAEHSRPVMTHCSRGPVFYRGGWEKSQFGFHPFSGIPLPKKPVYGEEQYNFTAHFTHPLNYLVLTDKEYLQVYLDRIADKEAQKQPQLWKQVQSMLGDRGGNRIEAPDLSKLKVCLAHWGGCEEWDRFLGDIKFSEVQDPLLRLTNPQKFQEVWNTYSWFSVISHLVSDPRFHFYTDISFTLHHERHVNLLKVMLADKEKVSSKVLFGTDFYVVAHKETEREFSVDVRAEVGEDKWQMISQINTEQYLHGINPDHSVRRTDLSTSKKNDKSARENGSPAEMNQRTGPKSRSAADNHERTDQK